jgi:lactate permease
MTTLLALLPLLLVLGLLASGRASALVAGLAGLSATLLASFIIVLQSRGSEVIGPLFLRETAAGAWLAWHVIAIIAAGMFFHRCLQVRDGAAAADGKLPANARRLWSVCFLLAPFGESVTGFGIGYIIALTALRRIGIGGLSALLLGLYSQSLVPWGALAIGTTVGATLAGLTPNQLGLGSALLQIPIHVLYLVIYWRLAREAGVTVSTTQKVDDAVWTAALLGLVWLLNLLSDVEIAGAAATALLLALRFWRDERPDQARLVSALKANAPYVALTIALCATRLVPPLRDVLKPLWALRPFDNQPAFAPLYAPGFWLVVIGLIVVGQARASLSRVLAETGRGAWRACAVTLLFVIMAEFYVGSGMAQSIAETLRAVAGPGSAVSVPVFAAVGGFLTGGAAAANAMLMPMVTALANAIAIDPAWVAAVQNSVCANLTMLSPIRVSMGAAILSLATPDSLLYRRAWPLALPPLLTGLAAIVFLLVRS